LKKALLTAGRELVDLLHRLIGRALLCQLSNRVWAGILSNVFFSLFSVKQYRNEDLGEHKKVTEHPSYKRSLFLYFW
jgi:hypothetical protein